MLCYDVSAAWRMTWYIFAKQYSHSEVGTQTCPQKSSKNVSSSPFLPYIYFNTLEVPTVATILPERNKFHGSCHTSHENQLPCFPPRSTHLVGGGQWKASMMRATRTKTPASGEPEGFWSIKNRVFAPKKNILEPLIFRGELLVSWRVVHIFSSTVWVFGQIQSGMNFHITTDHPYDGEVPKMSLSENQGNLNSDPPRNLRNRYHKWWA